MFYTYPRDIFINLCEINAIYFNFKFKNAT